MFSTAEPESYHLYYMNFIVQVALELQIVKFETPEKNMDDQNQTYSGKVDIERKKRNSSGRKNSKLTTLFLTLLSSTQGE